MATYEIILKNQTNKGRSAVASTATESSGNEQKPSDNGSGQGFNALAKGLVAYHKVAPWVNQVVSYQIGTIELRTGAKDLQEKAAFGWKIASGVLDIGTSIAAGAAVGNVVGAAIGAVVGVAHQVVNMEQNQNRLDLQYTIENQSVFRNITRAGTRGSRGGYNE